MVKNTVEQEYITMERIYNENYKQKPENDEGRKNSYLMNCFQVGQRR